MRTCNPVKFPWSLLSHFLPEVKPINRLPMILNYLKVALRSIFRNKLTSSINIAGLALALTSALLITFYASSRPK